MQANEIVDSVGFWLGAARLDGWENSYTGFGTSRDKTTYSEYAGMTEIGDGTLELLYAGDDIAARIVDVPPEETLRNGYALKIEGGSEDLEADTLKFFDDLGVNEKVIEADAMGRLYGGSCLLLGADDGRPASMPLVPERVRRLSFLEVVDRRYLWPKTFYETGPKRGEPETFTLGNPFSSAPRDTLVVHESRLILFRGARTTRTARARRLGWDYSWLQRPLDAMRTFAAGFKSVEILLTDGPQGVYGIKNLASMLGASGRATLEQRLQVIDMMRSTLRAVAIDSENEKFERASFNFSGIPEVLDKLMLRLAAAAPMPVTILMGQSPAGMNATGDSDFRWFYDGIKTRQKNYVGPRLRRLVDVALAAKEGPSGGTIPKSVTIEFEKLWTLDPKAEADRRQVVANTDKIYVDMGAVLPEEIALSRFTERGWSDVYEIDRDLREKMRDLENDRILSALENGEDPFAPPPPPGADPNADPETEPPNGAPPPARKDGFDEDEHARDEGGQFTSGPDANNGPKDKSASKAPKTEKAPKTKAETKPEDLNSPGARSRLLNAIKPKAAPAPEAAKKARERAQSNFDETAQKARAVADEGKHSDAMHSFLNVDRHAISKAERDGATHDGSERTTRFLKEAQAKGADYRGPVFRGTSAEELAQLTADGTNKTTWSVSKDPDGAAHFAKKGGVFIMIRQRSGAVPVDGLDQSNTFNEALIPKGSRWKIAGERTTKGVRIVTLEPEDKTARKDADDFDADLDADLDDQIDLALDNPDAKRPKFGDGGNLELWEDETEPSKPTSKDKPSKPGA